MRVLHILESLAAGGVETTFLNVMRHFPSSMTNDVLALAGGTLEAEYRSIASSVAITPRQSEIDRIVIDGHYDVAHLLFERCGTRVLSTLITRTKTAVVFGKNYDFSGQWRTTEGFACAADEAMLACCDGVTFTTPQLADGYPGERERSTILGKGAHVTPLLEIPAAGEHTPNRILVIANPHPRKRIADLINAVAMIVPHLPDVQLRVIGQGDPTEVTRLNACARDLGIGGIVDLAGPSRDVAGELCAARVVALSSASEGVPTALLEGMAAARPVVTTDAGHVRSIIDDGQEGFIVDVGDRHALATRLHQLLTNRQLAYVMGSRGRARARAHAVEQIASRLATVLAGHARPS